MQYTWGHPYGFDLASIPKAAVGQLRLASAPQVKVLIWLACAGQGQFDAEACAAACGASPSVCEEAFRYWVSQGLLVTPEAAPPNTVVAAEPPKDPMTMAVETFVADPVPTVVAPTLGGAPTVAAYPDRAQVLSRRAEDPAFAVLLETAASKLGKILSPSDMSVFLYVYRELSLPPEVILMVIGYAVQHGKGKMAYIEKTAIAWAEEGINTFEAADAHLRELEQCSEAWDKLCEIRDTQVARPTVTQKKIARRWIFEWQISPEVIGAAMDYTVEKTGKMQMAYADRVMERLHSLNITTAEGVKAELTAEKKPTQKKPSRARMKTAKDRAPSYDIAEYEKMVRRHRPTPPGEE